MNEKKKNTPIIKIEKKEKTLTTKNRYPSKFLLSGQKKKSGL
jgi:hypothetical protein